VYRFPLSNEETPAALRCTIAGAPRAVKKDIVNTGEEKEQFRHFRTIRISTWGQTKTELWQGMGGILRIEGENFYIQNPV